MSSQVKRWKTYVMHSGSRYTYSRHPLERWRVGARDEKEAMALLRGVVGKHVKVRIYYEEKEKLLPHGVVVKDYPGPDMQAGVVGRGWIRGWR